MCKQKTESDAAAVQWRVKAAAEAEAAPKLAAARAQLRGVIAVRVSGLPAGMSRDGGSSVFGVREEYGGWPRFENDCVRPT